MRHPTLRTNNDALAIFMDELRNNRRPPFSQEDEAPLSGAKYPKKTRGAGAAPRDTLNSKNSNGKELHYNHTDPPTREAVKNRHYLTSKTSKAPKTQENAPSAILQLTLW